jgi:carbon-monoxide dehydrogenase large subunit
MNSQEYRIGASVTRNEDKPFLTGNGQYVTNLDRPSNTGYLALLRSDYAHATIESIDTSAIDTTGVHSVFTAKDITKTPSPNEIQITFPDVPSEVSGHPLLAESKVRYHGEPIAAVVADSPEKAEDTAQQITVNYYRHDAVPD